MARDLALTVWRNVLDLDNRKHRWAVHTDTDEIHVHLVWNKRDNKGNLYNQHNDYAFFEKACQEIEEEYGLKVVKNRKSLNPGLPTSPKPSNEYRLENRGIKSEKSKFKEAVHAAADKAMTAGEFLEFLDRDGYTLIVNGSQGYALEKEGQIFKASEVGASYKLLKARFGDDPQFSETLARLGVKKAPEREMGGISFDMYVTQADLDQYEAKKKKSNRVLDTRFDSRNGHDYFFKDTNKKAFEYDALGGRVDFKSNSPTAVKAGIQKLIENVKKPTDFKLGGSDYAKSQIWLQFHLMGLDKKGHTISGYSPTLADKAKLEQEQNKFKNTAFDQINAVEKKLENHTPQSTNQKQKGKTPTNHENFTKFDIEDVKSKKQDKTRSEVAAESGAAGVLAGFVKSLDVEKSFSANSIEDKFSEMRVLEKGIKDKNEEAESQRHEQKKQNRRSRNMPKPQ